MMLYRKADAPLDFDFKAVSEQSKDNPVFYVQYAHARTESVRRQALGQVPQIDLAPSALGQADLAALGDAGERILVRQMADWPRTLSAAARSREPHRVAQQIQAAGVEKCSDLRGMLARSDFVSIHCVLNDDTRHLIGAAEFTSIKAASATVSSA